MIKYTLAIGTIKTLPDSRFRKGEMKMKTKRLVSVVLAVLMLLSVFAILPSGAFAATTGKTVTFVPGDANTASPAWFAWTWNTGDVSGKWVKGNGTDSVAFDGILGNVVFVRMPSGATAGDWDTRWNQTDDLNSADGNVFTFTKWNESIMDGVWSTVNPTNPTQSSDNAEGTYTATLNTGSYSADGGFFAWTWTNNGMPGHWVTGTKSGNNIVFSELCNRVIFASFTGVEAGGTPDDKWTGRVAQTETLTLKNGGTFTLSGKTTGDDGFGNTISAYTGAWTGGSDVPEVTPSTPAGTTEGTFSASVDMGSYGSDGSVFAWTWTLGELNGHWVIGTVDDGKITFTGLNNRIIFATFSDIPADEAPDKDWTGKVAQTEDLSLMHGGTFTISGKETKATGDYYKGSWVGGVAVPDEPETEPVETDPGIYSAKLNTGDAGIEHDWWAWTWNDGGAAGHWVQGTAGDDDTVTFDALCDTVIFGAFDGKPAKDWSNRVGQTAQLTVVNTATYTITNLTEGTDEFSGAPLTIYEGEWGEPEETEPASTTEPESETNETIETTEPVETTEATDATEATTAEVTTEPVETTEPTEATTAVPTTFETETATDKATDPATEVTTASTEATEPTTDAPTEETTVAPTEPATDAPTQPATDAPTQPATVAPTQAQPVDITNWQVVGLVNKTYTSKKLTQSVVVTNGTTVASYTATYTNNVNAGTATMIIQGKDGFTGTIVKTFKIAKASQKFTKAKAKTLTVKASRLKSNNLTFNKKVFTVKGNKGKLKYKKISGFSKIKVSSDGKVTFKKCKSFSKKSYTAKVKITAAATANYKPYSKTIKLTVKVKVKK